MNSATTNDLAYAMLRMYAPATAFAQADRYADDCAMRHDKAGHAKWAAVMVKIGAVIEIKRRLA